ncbi:MAG: NeuD/PglB/VioB family sugar acetyltransferase [Clostridia bacterium]|nr:NeuD/PglB/VioB family sugar acetyltransferase [Clostridia bacterium]
MNGSEKMKNIVIIGCGSFAREVNWIIGRINEKKAEFNVLGFVDDDASRHGETIDGVKVLGSVDELSKLGDVYTVCAVCNAKKRKELVGRVSSFENVKFATIVDPTAICHDSAEIGEGSILCTNTMVNINTKIGSHVAMVDRSAVGHDSVIGDFGVMFVGAVVAGNSMVDECCELGMNSSVIPGQKIGKNTVIGAGACVVGDIPSGCTAVGVPARAIK